MAKISMRRNFTMTDEDARRKLEGVASQLKDKYQVEGHWEGKRYQIDRGPGVKGYVELQTGLVAIELDLSLPASLLKGKIESRLKETLDKELA